MKIFARWKNFVSKENYTPTCIQQQFDDGKILHKYSIVEGGAAFEVGPLTQTIIEFFLPCHQYYIIRILRKP